MHVCAVKRMPHRHSTMLSCYNMPSKTFSGTPICICILVKMNKGRFESGMEAVLQGKSYTLLHKIRVFFWNCIA